MDITHTYHLDTDSYAQWAHGGAADAGADIVGHRTTNGAQQDLRDSQGRLLDHSKMEAENHKNPEDLDLFISCWIPQRMASKSDWAFSSRFVFPDILDCAVCLQRLDLFESSLPRTQQATINPAESLRIRRSEGWFPVRSFFVLENPTIYTKPLCIESCGPPRRHRVRVWLKPVLIMRFIVFLFV
jgi:hypothetical protein